MASQARCVYKPVAGERPLWDFPDGTLAGREVAAYEVSEATGWGVVPPTVLRDGPFGQGMCQLWIDTDPEVGAWSTSSPPSGHAGRLAARAGRAGRRRRAGRARCTPTTSGCGGWPSSTRCSTTPTARAATCCPGRTASCAASTTG